MDDQFFDEFTGAFCNSNFFIILMTLIPVGHISTVIGSDAGLSHNRSSNVTDDIINNSLSRAKLSRRSIDIETVIFGFVESVCERFEIRKRKRLGIKSRFHIKKQSSHKSTSEHGVWEKAYILPFFITVQSTFGDDHMYMGVPFKIASKCMKPTNHTGFEVSGMILFIEPIWDGLCSWLEENIKKSAILFEIPAKFFSNCEDDMAIVTVKEFGRYDLGSLGLISNAAGIAETGMASERDDLVSAAMRAAVHSKTTGGIAAWDDFLDFWMNYRADHIVGIFFSKGFPVILKYFADGDFRFHNYILKENER